jgi:predicted extracellular nuclease
VTINEPQTIYTEDTTFGYTNRGVYNYYLTAPLPAATLADSLAGADDGSGSINLTDPGITIWPSQSVIRTGQQTTINWNTNSVLNMNCRVSGPGNFSATSFNPSVNGSTGSSTSGTLTSAQIYQLNCTEPITGTTFSTSTRVSVSGTYQEI